MSDLTFVHETDPYRAFVDGLRAIAILFVLAFHAFPETVGGGYIGVDVFFVISGFLITGIIIDENQKKVFNFIPFYARRIRRLFPALMTVLLAAGATGFLLLSAHDFRELCNHMAGASAFAANIVQWQEAGYFDRSSLTKPLMHLWSLGIEEQFYLVWPLVFYGLLRLNISPMRGLWVMGTASFLFNLEQSNANQIAAFYSPLTRFWELTAGGILGCIIPRHVKDFPLNHKPLLAHGLGILGLSIIFGAGLYRNPDNHPIWLVPVAVAGSCMVIRAGEKAWLNRTLLSHPVLTTIGVMSYPLYLWHWPLLSFLRIYVGSKPNPILSLIALTVSFLLAALTYLWIEKPIRHNKKISLTALTLLLLMLVIGGASWWESRRTITLTTSTEKDISVQDQLRWNLWGDEACVRKYGVVPCLTNSDTPNLMILGDSHANHLYPGFAQSNPTMAVLDVGRCMPLEGVFMHVEKNQNQSSCASEDFLSAHKAILEKNPQIKTVIISARWRHLDGFIPNPDERALWGSVWYSSNHADEQGLTNLDVITAGFMRTLTDLDRMKIKTILIRDTPEMDVDFNTYCGVMKQKVPMNCTIDRQSFLTQRQTEDLMIHAIKQKFPSLAIYDPIDDFCDTDKCYFIKDGQILFRDIHHLSMQGSFYLAQRIKSWMAEQN